MERRESTQGPDDEAKNTNETTKTPRSRQGKGSSSDGGERGEKPENQKGHRTTRPRDRRKPRASRTNRNRKTSKDEEKRERKAHKSGKKNTKKMLGLSKTSSAIGKRASRRLTRASIHSPIKDNSEEVPAIPKRVFKALHLLRHEKFLRVVSRYIKPRVKE